MNIAVAAEPTLLVALTGGGLEVVPDAGPAVQRERLDLPLGRASWLPFGHQARYENGGATPMELLLFDFKTPPMSSEELRKKTQRHDHTVK